MEVLILLLALASCVDTIYYKIPNILIVIGMCVGLYMTSVTNIVQAVIIFVMMYPFFLIKGLGAGDIKLMMMTGCFMDYKTLLWCLLISMSIAAVISVIKIIFIEDCRERFYYLGRYVRKVALTGFVDNYEVDKTNTKTVIRLSIPMLLGTIITMAFV